MVNSVANFVAPKAIPIFIVCCLSRWATRVTSFNQTSSESTKGIVCPPSHLITSYICWLCGLVCHLSLHLVCNPMAFCAGHLWLPDLRALPKVRKQSHTHLNPDIQPLLRGEAVLPAIDHDSSHQLSHQSIPGGMASGPNEQHSAGVRRLLSLIESRSKLRTSTNHFII